MLAISEHNVGHTSYKNGFNSNIYDGEVCSVCTVFSMEEKVFKNSQNCPFLRV